MVNGNLQKTRSNFFDFLELDEPIPVIFFIFTFSFFIITRPLRNAENATKEKK